ncbi:MAG: DUF1565 domain-containing protein [Candidatus Hydrogenedentes bacterium]|jgi:hypothetical protein|nr:DUF1565 domain-containing protein [Candidatus Hydrogenedentota bacterium]
MDKFQVADLSKQAFTAAFLALFLLLTGTPGHAAVLRVNGASAADAPDGSSWAKAFKTIQSAVDAADTNDEIWVAQGTYTGTTASVVDISEKTLALYGGFEGTETDRDERNWEDNKTVIDGKGNRRCVTSNNAGIIDGFTVQNGKAHLGGGMSGGTATNCTFTGNTASYSGGGCIPALRPTVPLSTIRPHTMAAGCIIPRWPTAFSGAILPMTHTTQT